jgi:hypothetical protein
VNLRSALRLANEAGATGEIELGYHAAEEKMPTMGLFRDDVLHALAEARDGVLADESGMKWRLHGPIVDGSVIAVVVRFRTDALLLVVTVHPYP